MKTITETDRKQIAEDDELVIEGKLQGLVFEQLCVHCGVSGGISCKLFCSTPCYLARKYIDRLLPIAFFNYARWN